MSATKSTAAEPSSVAPVSGEVQEASLLDQIVAQGRFSKDAVSQERGRDMIKEFVAQVLEGHMTVSKDAEATIQVRIAQIDQLLSLQLNEILHHPAFQKLEATWRGIRYLMDQSETNSMLKIKVLNVSKRELLKDLQRASEFDQSALFKKVYEEEFGVFGGAPFAALLGDYEFGRGPEDIELLERIAQVSSAAHAPFLSAASAGLLNLEDFTQLGNPRDIGKIFDTTEYAKWKSFRQSEDSRYVGLALPHILMRLPYGKETKMVDEFAYEEAVDGTDHSKYLWGNAAFALGARLTNAFAKYGWCAAIRGVEGGMPHFSVCSRGTSRSSTTRTQPMLTRDSPRSFPTFSLCRGLHTISRRSCVTKSAASRHVKNARSSSIDGLRAMCLRPTVVLNQLRQHCHYVKLPLRCRMFQARPVHIAP